MDRGTLLVSCPPASRTMRLYGLHFSLSRGTSTAALMSIFPLSDLPFYCPSMFLVVYLRWDLFAFDIAVRHFSGNLLASILDVSKPSQSSFLDFATYCFCLLQSTSNTFVLECLYSLETSSHFLSQDMH